VVGREPWPRRDGVQRFQAVETNATHHQNALEKLDAKIDKVGTRLQSWEDKGFRPVHTAFRQGEFAALEGMTIAIKEEGRLRVFTVDPSLKISLYGKDVELKVAKLAPKTPIQFVLGDDNVQVIVITVEALPK
jgi:ABC-type sugar transport system ATPase subunit